LIGNRSDDEVLKLRTVLDSLSTEDVSENSNNDVIGIVLGILDHSVNEKELDSGILEAVGGEQQGNSVPLDNISNLDSRLVSLTGVKQLLSFIHKNKSVDE
jgi:hypothetical protein